MAHSRLPTDSCLLCARVATRSMQSTGSELHEELKMVLPQIQQRKHMLDIKKTPDIFIHQVLTYLPT